MKFPLIDRLFKAAPTRNSNEAPRAPAFNFGGRQVRLVDYRNVIAADRALQHPVIFRCLSKIATSVQQVRWYAEADPDVVATAQAGANVIKALNALLQTPNDSMAADQLRFWMALSYAVYGRAPFKVGSAGTSGVSTGIYALDAAFVTAKINRKGQIKEYKYGQGEGAESLPTKSAAGTGKPFVAEIATPTLAGTLETGKNFNALGAIGLPAQIIDELMRRAYDTASGHPNKKYVVAADKTLTQPQRDAFEKLMQESEPGGEESGSILFLYNTAVQVHALDNDMNNIHGKLPLDDMSRMIAGAFGIPISLLGLGAADGAKFAGNFIESRQSFWEDTIIPSYLTPIATGLTAALCPPGARIRFDLDSIDAVQDSRAGRAQKLERVSFLTNDEKREIAGFAPLTAEQRAQLTTEAANRSASGGSNSAPDNNSTQ